jgi:hypothetical protein
VRSLPPGTRWAPAGSRRAATVATTTALVAALAVAHAPWQVILVPGLGGMLVCVLDMVLSYKAQIQTNELWVRALEKAARNQIADVVRSITGHGVENEDDGC